MDLSQALSVNPTGLGFRLFGPAHLTALGIILALNLSLLPLRHTLGEVGRRRLRFGLATVLVLTELGYFLWQALVGIWTVQGSLPLHLCSVMTFVSAAVLVSRSRWLYELVYFLGIGGAMEALVTPALRGYGFPHLCFFEAFVTHGGIVTAAFYMTVMEGFRPTWRSVWRVAGCMLAYLVFILGINLLLGSNYLFIGHRPEFPSLIDVLGPWPWYILSLMGVGMATLLILYLPFAAGDLWTRRKRASGA